MSAELLADALLLLEAIYERAIAPGLNGEELAVLCGSREEAVAFLLLKSEMMSTDDRIRAALADIAKRAVINRTTNAQKVNGAFDPDLLGKANETEYERLTKIIEQELAVDDLEGSLNATRIAIVREKEARNGDVDSIRDRIFPRG